MGYTILITGATGYLGSALCVALSGDHNVIGLFKTAPSKRLKVAAPDVQWVKGDVVEDGCLRDIFNKNSSLGYPIDYVIHFAAHTDYGKKWHDEYDNTNVIGTENIINLSIEAGVKRILFASSIAALVPLDSADALTENSFTFGNIAYSKSKGMGEQLFVKNSDRQPAIILRLGGVYSDWCELPPLFSLMNLWSKPFIGKVIPGQGLSGFPYIHRKDVVKIVKKIVENDDDFNPIEIFFASPSGCTFQKDLFPIIRRECNPNFTTTPINSPHIITKLILHIKFITNTLLNKKTYERAWMVQYIDRPLVVDTKNTTRKLNWKPTPELHILERLPILMHHFNHHHNKWVIRNINRNDQKYQYYPD